MTLQAVLQAILLPPWMLTAYARCCFATSISTMNQKSSLLICVMKSLQDHGTKQFLATEHLLLFINIVMTRSERRVFQRQTSAVAFETVNAAFTRRGLTCIITAKSDQVERRESLETRNGVKASKHCRVYLIGTNNT